MWNTWKSFVNYFVLDVAKKDLNDRSSVNRKNWHSVGISAKEDDAVKSSVNTQYMLQKCVFI